MAWGGTTYYPYTRSGNTITITVGDAAHTAILTSDTTITYGDKSYRYKILSGGLPEDDSGAFDDWFE